jgi:hypothetical protein
LQVKFTIAGRRVLRLDMSDDELFDRDVAVRGFHGSKALARYGMKSRPVPR